MDSMSAAAPSLDDILSGLSSRAADTPGAGPGKPGDPPSAAADAAEEENLDAVEETVVERLVGLTEMVPDPVWAVGEKGFWWSLWFVRRAAWVLGTSLALLALPPFVEQQRVEYEEMQNMQKKQLMLGQGGPSAFPAPPPSR